jgi:hypothetical protein
MVNNIAQTNSALLAHDPTILTQGLHIQHGKYLIVPDKWAQTVNPNTAIYVWIYYIEGLLEDFLNVGAQVGYNNFYSLLLIIYRYN